MSLGVKERSVSKEWKSWCINAYNKHEQMFSPLYRIDAGTWILLATIIKQRSVKNVIEFGSGLSTVLMDELGVEVISFENFPEYMPQVELKNSRIITYNTLDPLPKFDADMAFIDGPGGFLERDLGYWYVSNSSIPLAVCDDTNRSDVVKLINRYFADWVILGRVTCPKGVRSLALRRRNESDNKL